MRRALRTRPPAPAARRVERGPAPRRARCLPEGVTRLNHKNIECRACTHARAAHSWPNRFPSAAVVAELARAADRRAQHACASDCASNCDGGRARVRLLRAACVLQRGASACAPPASHLAASRRESDLGGGVLAQCRGWWCPGAMRLDERVLTVREGHKPVACGCPSGAEMLPAHTRLVLDLCNSQACATGATGAQRARRPEAEPGAGRRRVRRVRCSGDAVAGRRRCRRPPGHRPARAQCQAEHSQRRRPCRQLSSARAGQC
jgi:hypothetical protein